MELEIKKGEPSPIDGVLFDYDSYREVVATDLFHDELKKSYLILSSKCTSCEKSNENNYSIKDDVIKIMLGFIAGATVMSLAK